MFKKISLFEVREKSRRANAEINNNIHWFSSKFSIYFSYFFINIGLSADRVTNLFFLAGFLGAVYVKYPIISYLLWRLHIILDMSDGDIARFNRSYSTRGKYWDRLNHSVINPAYCFFIGLNFFNKYDDVLYLYLGALMMFSQSFILNSKYLIESDYSEVRFRMSNNMILIRVKNIIIDLLGMEGVLLILVLFADIHSKLIASVLMVVYVFIFFSLGLFKIFKRSY
jgi:phosphatidylglycerophosphate synthase